MERGPPGLLDPPSVRSPPDEGRDVVMASKTAAPSQISGGSFEVDWSFPAEGINGSITEFSYEG